MFARRPGPLGRRRHRPGRHASAPRRRRSLSERFPADRRLARADADRDPPEDVDLRRRWRGTGRSPNPVFTASGLRRRRPRARAVLRRRRARRGRHQVDHARAALRPADAADGRDAERHAQLDRPAGPGHRRASSSATCPGWTSRAPAPSCRSPAARSRSTPSSPTGCAAARGVVAIEVNISCPNVEDRGLVFACDPRAAARRRARRAPAHRAVASRCFAKLSPGRHRHRRRSPRPASTPAPTGCR